LTGGEAAYPKKNFHKKILCFHPKILSVKKFQAEILLMNESVHNVKSLVFNNGDD